MDFRTISKAVGLVCLGMAVSFPSPVWAFGLGGLGGSSSSSSSSSSGGAVGIPNNGYHGESDTNCGANERQVKFKANNGSYQYRCVTATCTASIGVGDANPDCGGSSSSSSSSGSSSSSSSGSSGGIVFVGF